MLPPFGAVICYMGFLVEHVFGWVAQAFLVTRSPTNVDSLIYMLGIGFRFRCCILQSCIASSYVLVVDTSCGGCCDVSFMVA